MTVSLIELSNLSITCCMHASSSHSTYHYIVMKGMREQEKQVTNKGSGHESKKAECGTKWLVCVNGGDVEMNHIKQNKVCNNKAA